MVQEKIPLVKCLPCIHMTWVPYQDLCTWQDGEGLHNPNTGKSLRLVWQSKLQVQWENLPPNIKWSLTEEDTNPTLCSLPANTQNSNTSAELFGHLTRTLWQTNQSTRIQISSLKKHEAQYFLSFLSSHMCFLWVHNKKCIKNDL